MSGTKEIQINENEIKERKIREIAAKIQTILEKEITDDCVEVNIYFNTITVYIGKRFDEIDEVVNEAFEYNYATDEEFREWWDTLTDEEKEQEWDKAFQEEIENINNEYAYVVNGYIDSELFRIEFYPKMLESCYDWVGLGIDIDIKRLDIDSDFIAAAAAEIIQAVYRNA
jgi:hypothetical protein